MTDAATEGATGGAIRVASAFLFFGRIGFWIQFVLLIAVAILGIYTFIVVGGRARTGNVLAFLGLALPIFTTYWCYRYWKFGQALADTPASGSFASAARKAWIGVLAGTTGVVVSMLSLFGAASALMVVLLANPQIGIQIAPVTGGASAYSISAVDAVSIMSLVLTLTAEMIVVALSLRLFFIADAVRTTTP